MYICGTLKDEAWQKGILRQISYLFSSVLFKEIHFFQKQVNRFWYNANCVSKRRLGELMSFLHVAI